MANPRKFSEKIALHNHRQAEETARFEQVMKEVLEATAGVQPDRGAGKNALRVNNSQALGSFRGGSLPNVSAGAPTVKTTSHITDSKPEDPMQVKVHYREGSRPRPQGGPMRRQDRKHDTSPYSTGPFLSPPSDTGWRRTNSDSALHHSAMQGGMGMEKRNENSNSRWMLQTLNGPEQHDGRPRSCEVPRVPGINIYPSAHEPGTVQIPIGNNTGSLPDLTSVHFPSPIHTPLDQDQDQGSSPYSSSPANTSPSTLSPTSVPPGVRQQARFPFSGPPVSQHQQNHLSVPVNSRYLHHNKGVTLENNLISLLDKTDYAQLGMGAMYQQQIPPQSPSPTLQQPTGYRSPRPSPQSSPGLGHHSAPCSPGAPSPLSNDYHILNQHQANQLQHHFEQFSMDWAQLVASLVESGCTWTAQVQVDAPLSPISNATYVEQPNSVHHSQTQPQTLQEIPGAVNAELSGDGGYYSTSPSQLVYPTAPPSLHTTPNTPTSIPDIILTDETWNYQNGSQLRQWVQGTDFRDFSTADDITRQELSLSKQLEAELLSEESLREGLGPIDLDGLQMLSDPTMNLISDGVEDHFRLDRS